MRTLGKENFDLREYQRVYKSIFTELTDKNRSSTIQNEAQTRNAEIRILCDKCTYTAFNNEDLRKHKNDAHSNIRINTSFKCSKCDLVALDKTGLEKHTRDLHVYKCTYCSYFGTCQNNLDVHIRDIHSYMCQECGHNFNTNDDLSKHSTIHLSHCTKCPYTCQNRQTMHKHMRSAHPAMWNCEFCNYETKSVNDLSFHEKVVHSGQLFFVFKM